MRGDNNEIISDPSGENGVNPLVLFFNYSKMRRSEATIDQMEQYKLFEWF